MRILHGLLWRGGITINYLGLAGKAALVIAMVMLFLSMCDVPGVSVQLTCILGAIGMVLNGLFGSSGNGGNNENDKGEK